VLNLRIIRTARRITDAVRSVTNPAALVLDQEQQDQVPAVAAEPDGLYTEADMPELADIERACFGFDLAADSARSADRAKRKHRRLLDRLPAGLYNGWLVSRTPSNRQVADLEAIRATYARLGLGPVPMRTAAPSLRVTRAEVLAEVTA
jgi:hypothetical protein